MSGNHADVGSSLVLTNRLPVVLSTRKKESKAHATKLNATKFNMMVEITSLTPRLTFSQPAKPAQIAPVAMATTRQKRMCNGAGKSTAAPATAVAKSATLICPSTPMLKRFILKPMATAAAEIMSGVARLSAPCKTLVSPAAPNSVR